jgi:TetR/AcrR family transcriptional regulator
LQQNSSDTADAIGATAPSGRGRSAARAEAVERILSAAERVFAQKGLEGARVNEIAEAAGLPKANLLYYFGNKEKLYRAVVENIVVIWLDQLGEISAEDDPRQALQRYIRQKMRLARLRPNASRVFAQEVVSGAPVVGDFLRGYLRSWVQRQSAVIDAWIAQGRIDPVDPAHLFFTIWAATQTYADFAPQIQAVLDTDELSTAEFEAATEQVCRIILKGIGLA